MNSNHVQKLREHGVQLVVDPQTGQLRCHLPAGALAADLRDLAAEVALEYEERAAILEYSAGMTRKDAERLAAVEATGCGDPRCSPDNLISMSEPWPTWRPRRRGPPPPIIPRPIVCVSVVDSLNAQIEKLKAKAQDAGTAGEIRRLGEIVVALQKLQGA